MFMPVHRYPFNKQKNNEINGLNQSKAYHIKILQNLIKTQPFHSNCLLARFIFNNKYDIIPVS